MSIFEPCPTCGGSGEVMGDRAGGMYPCSRCVGGRVVSESVIEEMKDAALLTLYPTKANLREPEWIQDRFRSVARAVGRVVLEHMEDNERTT